MKKVVFFILLLCTLGSPSLAQDTATEPLKCDLPTLQKVIDIYVDGLGKIKTGNEADPVKVANVLQVLSNEANRLRATCDDLSFSGKKQLVIGPVTIPEGIYRAIATTAKYMIVHVDTISGECGVGTRMSASSLFNLSEGEATDGAESIFASKGCSALISVENVTGEWKLTFERITTD